MNYEFLTPEENAFLTKMFYDLTNEYNIYGFDHHGSDNFSLGPTNSQEFYPIYISFTLKGKEPKLGNIQLQKYRDKLVLQEFVRISPDHKGVMTKLLILLILKSIELNLPIHFKAETIKTHGIHNKPATNLYKYYNTLGFTRTKNNNNSANHKNYITTVETLIQIIKGWIERSKSKEFVGGGGGEGGGGGINPRKSRKSCKSRKSRKSRRV